MAIIARANPDDITRIAPLPGVRNSTRVSSEPVSGMADAVRGVVSTVGDVYQQARDKADTAQYMEAQNRLSDWKARWTDPNNAQGMQSFKGRAALGLHEAMLPDLDKTVGDITAGMSPRAREKFMQYASDFRSRTYSDINGYATAQNDAYMAQQRKAYVETQANELVNAQLTDPERYKQVMATTLDTIYADAAANGDAPDATALSIRNLKSGVHAGVIDQLLSQSPTAAKDYYTEHADELQEGDRAKVLRVLQPLYEDARADEDADAAMNGGAFHVATPPKQRGTPSPAIRATIENAAKAHGVPVEVMLALAEQESSFDPKAVNQQALDDGDHATGLFQYRKTTADALGIDRTDPVASANAAAKEFRARMDSGGVDYAIAAHFAGDAGADAVVKRGKTAQNPRTAAYLDEVKGRAQRWRGEVGKAMGAADVPEPQASTGPIGMGLASNEADALDRLQGIDDPRRRNAAEAKIKDRFAIQKMRQAEAERQTEEQINSAVWTAPDPTLPLQQIIGKDAYAYAARKGTIGALTDDLKYRIGNPVRKDVPDVVGAYLEAMRRNPEVFANMDVMKNARHMTADTATQLVKLQEKVRDGKYDVAEFATESDQLDALVYGPLKMVGQTAQAKAKRAPFEAAWYQVKANWSAAHPGKTMGAEERDGALKRLRASFALQQTKGFEAFDISEADRKAIIDTFRKKGIANPTDEQINRTYLIGVGR